MSEAVQLYRETIERFPHDVVARNGLAQALKEMGQLEEAEDVLRQTLVMFPNAAPVLTNLADVLMRAGKYDSAIDTYREAMVRFPENVVARNGLADALRRAGRETSINPTAQLSNHTFKYQVALSFAGEDRETVQRLADLLDRKGVSIFYDQYEKANLWGKDIYQYLQHIYRDAAQFCIVFLSDSYAKKLWTRHELRQAQERAFKENREYILPIRLDDTKIPGIGETIGYIDIRTTPLEEIANLILEKVGSK